MKVMVNTEQKHPNWTYKTSKLLRILLPLVIVLLNTDLLVINVQAIQNPIEHPVLESTHYIQPFGLSSFLDYTYFNHSVYFVNDYPYSIIKGTFNENNSNIESVSTNPIKTNPNLQIGFFYWAFTTNGNRSFIFVDRSV